MERESVAINTNAYKRTIILNEFFGFMAGGEHREGASPPPTITKKKQKQTNYARGTLHIKCVLLTQHHCFIFYVLQLSSILVSVSTPK